MQARKKLKPCGKKKFKDKQLVQQALTKARENSADNEGRKENRYYYCRQCHAYHLIYHNMKVIKNRCGGKKKGCSLAVVKKLVEFPYYIENKAA